MAGHPFFAPDFAVKISGLTMAADVRHAVTSLIYDNSLDTADMFTIQLNNADLRLTDSALFDVGKQVEIHMGYVGELEPMLLGEVTAVNPSFPEGGAPTITIAGYDKSHRMRHNAPAATTYRLLNDSLIAAQLAAENLLIPIIDPSPMPPKDHVQYGSDWAFLQELADRNFFQLYVRWDKLYFRFPRPQTKLVVLEWGKNLSSFSPRLSTSGQFGIEVVRGYDEQLAQTIVAILPAFSLGSDLDNIIERLGSSFVDQLVNLGRHTLHGQAVNSFIEANVLAASILQQLLQGLFEGSGNCIGIPTLRAGDMVEIRGIGKRFSGKYTLSKVTHTIDGNGYRTSFEVTQKYTSNLLQSLRRKISDAPPPNRRDKIEGVIIGKVINNVGDPLGLGRVQLTFPHLSDINISPWARIATLMAGGTPVDSWGAYFLPDIGDEVLVTFLQGDVNTPIVIGALWNGLAPPPEMNDGINAKKVIKTRGGLQITFDDTPGLENLMIEDKAGNTILLDSLVGFESLSITDKAGASITLSAQTGAESVTIQDKIGSRIKMDSLTGDVTIEAKGNLVLKSGPAGKLDLNP